MSTYRPTQAVATTVLQPWSSNQDQNPYTLQPGYTALANWYVKVSPGTLLPLKFDANSNDGWYGNRNDFAYLQDSVGGDFGSSGFVKKLKSMPTWQLGLGVLGVGAGLALLVKAMNK